MAIRISHTPYGAIGKLAERAGKTQQAVREQKYEFTATQQAKSIAANLQAQRERIGAEMEMQNDRLEQNQVQFDKDLELKTAQVSAQESATHYSYINNKQQLEQQAEQFEQGMAVKEKAFEIETAMRDRQLTIAEQTGELAVDRFLADQELRQQNMELWQSLEGSIDPDTYMNGVLAVQSGRMPQLPDPQQAKLMSESQQQRLDLTRKQMQLKQQNLEQKNENKPLDKKSQERAAVIAEGLLPGQFTKLRPSTPGFRKQKIYEMYHSYTNGVNYGGMGVAQKADADAIFQQTVRNYGWGDDISWGDLESIQDTHQRFGPLPSQTIGRSQPTAQSQTTTPTQTSVIYEPPKGEGRQITSDVVAQYMQQAKGNAGVAREMARDAGWKF